MSRTLNRITPERVRALEEILTEQGERPVLTPVQYRELPMEERQWTGSVSSRRETTERQVALHGYANSFR